MKLNTLDPRWDNNVIEYDITKHNWRKYFEDAVREKYPQIQSLEQTHLAMKPEELNDFFDNKLSIDWKSSLIKNYNKKLIYLTS